MLLIFGSFLVIPCTLTSCHVVTNKQGSMIGAVGYSRRVTGRRSRDENQVVRFGQNAENRSRAWDTPPIRGVYDELARWCKRWHPLAPGTSYGKKKSSLWVYFFPSISQTNNSDPLMKIKWEIYVHKEGCFVRLLSLIMFLLGSMRLCCTIDRA